MTGNIQEQRAVSTIQPDKLLTYQGSSELSLLQDRIDELKSGHVVQFASKLGLQPNSDKAMIKGFVSTLSANKLKEAQNALRAVLPQNNSALQVLEEPAQQVEIEEIISPREIERQKTTAWVNSLPGAYRALSTKIFHEVNGVILCDANVSEQQLGTMFVEHLTNLNISWLVFSQNTAVDNEMRGPDCVGTYDIGNTHPRIKKDGEKRHTGWIGKHQKTVEKKFEPGKLVRIESRRHLPWFKGNYETVVEFSAHQNNDGTLTLKRDKRVYSLSSRFTGATRGKLREHTVEVSTYQSV